MKKTLLVIGAILAGIGLFVGGFFFSRLNVQTIQPGWMMGDWNNQVNPNVMNGWKEQYGPGMMNNRQYGPGLMDGGKGGGMMGMMMGGGMMGGQYGPGMMGSFGSLTNADPLSVEASETAVTSYLSTLNQDNLALGEIMIFDNHAYAQILDETTETGAFEVLVDPVSGNVFPEPGPTMMWNTAYGMMSGSGFGGMMGGNMMGSFGYAPDAEINISAEEASASAQEYLDAYLTGKTAGEQADSFPGYYTFHVLEDGETIGMLSVNAYTDQVFPHHWHGDFIEMAGAAHE